jgi:hypothetical protein
MQQIAHEIEHEIARVISPLPRLLDTDSNLATAFFPDSGLKIVEYSIAVSGTDAGPLGRISNILHHIFILEEMGHEKNIRTRHMMLPCHVVIIFLLTLSMD